MRFRLSLRHKAFRLMSLGVIGLAIASYFQNCTPIGESAITRDLTLSSAASTVLDPCSKVVAPQLSNGPANQTMKSGMGQFAGNQFVQNLSVRVSPSSPAQVANLICESSNNQVNVNCNNPNNISLSVGNRECVSGSSTITIRARDSICQDKVSNAVSFQVTVEDVCLAQTKLGSPDPAQLDQFGSAVAISGNIAVVLAVGDDEKAQNAGAAYVYRFDGARWVHSKKLMPSGLSASAELRSVAFDGNTLLLGSPYQDGVGAVYVYRFDGTNFIEGPSLTPSQVNGFNDDLFGYSVSLSGGLIAVGAPGNHHIDSGTRLEAGSVFMFQDNGSTVAALGQIRASNAAAGDFFGASVGVSGSRVIVGAPSSPLVNKSQFTGKAYIFTIDGSRFTETILASTSAVSGSEFGAAVSISGLRAVVGAPGGSGAGAIISFSHNGLAWTQAQAVAPQGGANGHRFGASLSLDGTSLVVGSPAAQVNTGAAYFFRLVNNQWTQVWRLQGRQADRGEQDFFGESVGVSGERFITGSRLDDDQGLNSGSVFIINLP